MSESQRWPWSTSGPPHHPPPDTHNPLFFSTNMFFLAQSLACSRCLRNLWKALKLPPLTTLVKKTDKKQTTILEILQDLSNYSKSVLFCFCLRGCPNIAVNKIFSSTSFKVLFQYHVDQGLANIFCKEFTKSKYFRLCRSWSLLQLLCCLVQKQSQTIHVWMRMPLFE